ncbi:hypothetical protein [Streptomyces showdoensis]|uniref:Lipoprotein n=1 Tax=Streptomyces showdoensis TaxID=68268 RepID=A0A2P2GG38_STREW|nr:hypothetical protein [Streptomyces showdoensis]KKZ70461.1 lipoprotein [Streptomyces showdoensis]
MASHTTKLRAAATAVCAAVIVGGAPAALAQTPSEARAPALSAPAPAPSTDPFQGLTADQIADRAVAATRSATSLRMTGRVVSAGERLGVDFSVNDHDECTGAVRIQGGAAQLRQSGGVTYMKGDEGFWRSSMTSQGMPPEQIGPTIELLKGRWLKITAGQAGSSDLGGVCDLKSFLADLGKDTGRTGLTRGPDGVVAGVPVATLVEHKPGGETTTVSVSQRGKPYILKVVKTGGDEPGTLELSAYDKPVKVVIPPADETVDLAKLDQGTSA